MYTSKCTLSNMTVKITWECNREMLLRPFSRKNNLWLYVAFSLKNNFPMQLVKSTIDPGL
jgi:hypothetical protein